jgi:predicted metal-dependent hydrolase
MNDKSGPYDSRYLAGIDYFNRCDFFEAHEVWEDLWVDIEGPARTFYQGLIQVAVCLHHFGNGNIRGSRKLYHSSCKYLEPHLPVHLGLDVEKLIRELTHCCQQFLESDEEYPQAEIEVEKIPEIHLEENPEPGLIE